MILRLSAFLSSFLPRRERAEAVRGCQDEPVELGRLLIVSCRRGGVEFRLMTGKLSTSRLLFFSQHKLEPGDELEFCFLLRHYRVRGSGRVLWTLRSERGWHGELAMELEPEYSQRLSSYLKR